MYLHEFEAWVARRDPEWYLKSIDEVFGMIVEYQNEEGLERDEHQLQQQKYALEYDMKVYKMKRGKKIQLRLF
jgi:hypothetical protein